MKLSAKICLSALIVALMSKAAAQTPTVIPVSERNLTLALATELLTTKSSDYAATMGQMRDPFEVVLAQVAVAVAATSVVVGPAAPSYNDRQVLEAIAPRVVPTGTARIGETDYLLFGQKRLKQGELLTITYEGSAYLIEIVSIQRNNFRIRLNSEELVRPIK